MSNAPLEVQFVDGPARAGVVRTARGTFTTPCFMPVGTRGAVRLLDAADLDQLGPQVVLANTYHLMLRPGTAVVEALGGLHRFTGWEGHLLTDSGGFQVFSLNPRIDDDGVDVSFRLRRIPPPARRPKTRWRSSPASARTSRWPSTSAPALPAPEEEIRLAARRTLAWAVRARAAQRRPGQCLFGIVQGGVISDLRAEHARAMAALDFDGYGIGGLSVGEPRPQLLLALAAALSELPPDRPRYLMGVGDPVTLLDAVGLGVDMFDCVLPTRLARHGTALTSAGRYQLRAPATPSTTSPSTRSVPAGSAPVSAAATCVTCWSPTSRPVAACSASTTWPGCSIWSTRPGTPSAPEASPACGPR